MSDTNIPRYRVMMKTDGRVVIPKKLRDAIEAKESSLLELSLYQIKGKNKILIEVLTT